MTKQPVFKPFPLCTGCHAQTIAASFLSISGNLPSLKRFVYLPDGDKIVIEISTPKKWKESDPTIILVHGLCGSSRSTYMTRIARKLYKKSIRTVRINLRSCGMGRGHGKKMYHSEASEDVWRVLQEVKRDTPDSPLTLVGFSLGGNTVLKAVGDYGEEAKGLLHKVISVNPPVDMQSSIELLSQNTFYERYFMASLREDVAFLHESFSDLPPIQIPNEMTLLEFNEFYIAPQSGHNNARDYYHACSSGRLIHNIAIECHILFALDDPIVDCTVVDLKEVPENVDILITENGGHLGYLGTPGQQGGFHWMDSILLQWIFENGE
ncbi:MAG: alpha/beta fold hydrolase [Chlamydiia bacterium]|nr:alpha/beta fold hydrolase [Chlamydiia bacterium]